MSRKTMPGLGKSGMSRMWRRSSILPALYHIRAPRGRPARGERGQVEERVAGDVVPAHLEVEVRPRGLAALADQRDDLPLADLRARARPVLAIVRVDGRVAVVVRDDDQVTVAAQVVAVEHASRARGAHGCALRGADVDAVVMGLAARAEGRGHHPRLDRPPEGRGAPRQLGGPGPGAACALV